MTRKISSASRFTLLVTGAGGVAVPGIIAHLHSQGVRAVAVDMNPLAVGLAYADRGYCVPPATSPDFLPAIRRICQEERVDVAVPLVDEELLTWHQLGLPAVQVLTPRPAFIAMCLDKHRLGSELLKHGIPAPRSQLLSERIDALGFPVILKPRTGRGSRDVKCADSPAALRRMIATLERPADEMMLQEYVDGPEFTVSVVVWRDGAVQAIVPKEIIAKKGVTQMAVTRREPAIEELCLRLQSTLRADGPFNVQLRIDRRTGVPLLFEINPRFSTTVTHTMAAGVDELYGLACQAVGGPGAHRFGAWTENLVLRRRSVDEFLPETALMTERQSKLCDVRS